MSKGRKTGVLNVFAQDELMGTITVRQGGVTQFRYSPAWTVKSGAFPMSLSMPLSNQVYTTEVVTFLDNLLPDLPEVRSDIAARVGAQGPDPFSLIWELGRDCVGSLQFIPDGEPPPTETGTPSGAPLSDDEIAELLRSLATTPLGVGRSNGGFRISVAGAQEKTALLQVNGKWFLPTGSTPSTHIIKPAIGKRGQVDLSFSAQNEHLCLHLLNELGLEAAQTEVHSFGNVTTVVVKRFDRKRQEDRIIRLPQEDMCQALGVPSFLKYENEGGPGMAEILDLMKLGDDPAADTKRFIQATYAFWLLGATDGHAKNFSVSLGTENSFRLAPLYDVVSLQPAVDAFQVNRRDYRLAMAVGTNRHYRVDEVMPRHFVQTAAAAGIVEETAVEWLVEINRNLPAALERARRSTQGVVPESLFDSIAHGAQKRAALGL